MYSISKESLGKVLSNDYKFVVSMVTRLLF